MKALTRREVIESWNKNKQNIDYFVCPDCRDLLEPVGKKIIRCNNLECLNTDSFDIKTGELL